MADKTLIATLTNDTFISATGEVTFVAASTGVTAVAANPPSATLTLPSLLADDIIIIHVMSKNIVEASNEIATPTTADGTFTEKGSKVEIDSSVAADDMRSAVYWKRASAANSGASVTISRAGTDTLGLYAKAYVFRGCVKTGDPFDSFVAGAGDTTADDIVNFPAIDPTGTSVHVCGMFVHADDASTPPATFDWGGLTFVLRAEDETTTGSDATMGLYSLTTDGSSQAADSVDIVATAGSDIGYSFALTPYVFNHERQAAINGIVSAQSEDHGWNVERSNIPVTALVRTSDSVATLTIPSLPNYDITAQEVLTWTIPAAILTSGVAIVATPTVTIDAVTGDSYVPVTTGGYAYVDSGVGIQKAWVSDGGPSGVFDLGSSISLAVVSFGSADEYVTVGTVLRQGIATSSGVSETVDVGSEISIAYGYVIDGISEFTCSLNSELSIGVSNESADVPLHSIGSASDISVTITSSYMPETAGAYAYVDSGPEVSKVWVYEGVAEGYLSCDSQVSVEKIDSGTAAELVSYDSQLSFAPSLQGDVYGDFVSGSVMSLDVVGQNEYEAKGSAVFTYRPHAELWAGIYRDPVATPLHDFSAQADLSVLWVSEGSASEAVDSGTVSSLDAGIVGDSAEVIGSESGVLVGRVDTGDAYVALSSDAALQYEPSFDDYAALDLSSDADVTADVSTGQSYQDAGTAVFVYRPHTELYYCIIRTEAVPLHCFAASSEVSVSLGVPYQAVGTADAVFAYQSVVSANAPGYGQYVPVTDGATANVSSTKRYIVAVEASSLIPSETISTGDAIQPSSFMHDGDVSAVFSSASVLSLLVQANYQPATESASVGVTLASAIEVVAQQAGGEVGASVFVVGVTSHKVIALEASALIPAQVVAEPSSEYIIEIYRNESEVIYGHFVAEAVYGKGTVYQYTIEGVTFSSFGAGSVVTAFIHGPSSHTDYIGSVVAALSASAGVVAESAQVIVPDTFGASVESIVAASTVTNDVRQVITPETSVAEFIADSSSGVTVGYTSGSGSAWYYDGDVAAAVQAAASVLANLVETIGPVVGVNLLFQYGSDILINVRSWNYGRTVEPQPTIYATLEPVPSDWPAVDGAYTEPLDDGAWDEYPVDGAYTQIGYPKERRPRRRYSTRTWESVPTEHNTTESKPAYAGTKEGVPH